MIFGPEVLLCCLLKKNVASNTRTVRTIYGQVGTLEMTLALLERHSIFKDSKIEFTKTNPQKKSNSIIFQVFFNISLILKKIPR
jgi:hypothetical protein